MNVHDSERVAGLLEEAGYRKADQGQNPDLVVFNTCAVRENAADRLYGNLGHLLPAKKAHAGMQIAVGGCLAQMERQQIIDRAPWVDVVYGTHNIGALPRLLEQAREREQAQVEFEETLSTFPSLLPARRQSAYSAWVSISVGCNNTCTFCIVPSLRGKEKDRRPGDILDEVRSLVDQGVIEVTLLGQNVNSYGAEFGDRLAFGKLLRACGEIHGLERVRFTSPAPEGLHRRRHRGDAGHAERHAQPAHAAAVRLGHDPEVDAPGLPPRPLPGDRGQRARSHIPDAAITTDIIVGFPGETEDDFQETLDTVRQARFSSAFTFQYSIRAGTPAATMDGQVPRAVVQERYDRLVALQEEISWDEHKKQNGAVVEVLVAEGEGRKDAATHRLSGRARDNRLVHFVPDAGPGAAAPGRHRHHPGHQRRPALPAGRRDRRSACAAPAPATPGPPASSRRPSPAAATGPGRGPAPVLLGMPAVRG